LYINNWIHPANGTGLFYDAGVHFHESGNNMHSNTGLSSANQGYLWGASNDGSGSGLDADTLDGLHLNSSTRNNQTNRVVRTQSDGYAEFGWINTTSGNTTSTITDVYVNTNDGYIRKATKAHFNSQMGLAGYNTATSSTGYFALPKGTSAQRPSSPTQGMMRYNTQLGEYEVYTSSTWRSIDNSAYVKAIEYTVIAGGGGGGGGEWHNSGGGGGGAGAGGMIVGSQTVPREVTSWSVTIGAGGAGANQGNNNGANGSHSTLGSLTAIGGGGGAGDQRGASSGGSGGGGGGDSGGAGSGTSGQGNSGSHHGAGRRGGGGGGKGASGSSRNGGSGYTWNGASYAGGGGGGSGQDSGRGTPGSGGGYGSRSGGYGSANGTHATAYTGGGGGGQGGRAQTSSGYNGGSGKVIIRYAGGTIATGGSISYSGGYTYHTFTSAGTFSI